MSFSDEPTSAVMEKELRSLVPVAPDADFLLRLTKRMDGALSAGPTNINTVGRISAFRPAAEPATAPAKPTAPTSNGGKWNRMAPWAAAAAVTAAATSGQFWSHTTASKENALVAAATSRSERIQQAVRAHREVQKVRDDGVTVDPSRGALRSISLQYNNNYEFQDDQGARMGYQFPTEERMVIPLKFY